MSRIPDAFARARAEKRKALIAYVCAGDPTLAATADIVPKLIDAGADIVELGAPFSDPLADGPTIQAASQRALASGTTLSKTLDLVATLRANGVTVPLVLMGYLNPIVAMGAQAFAAKAKTVGLDGVIVPDLPVDEADELSDALSKASVDLILLAAPTTPEARLKLIGARTRGFLYFVSVTGVTGARAELPKDLPARIDAAKAATSVPVAVGFGVSTREQARALGQHADGVVVGSAIVDRIFRSKGDASEATALVRDLAEGLK